MIKESATQDNTEIQTWSLNTTPYNNRDTQLCHN